MGRAHIEKDGLAQGRKGPKGSVGEEEEMAETASGGEETTAPPNKQVVRAPSPSLMAEDVRRTALESTSSVRDLVSHYRSYEDAFFNKITGHTLQN